MNWKSVEHLFSDQKVKLILKHTKTPKSALEISNLTKLPRVTVYRKIKDLKEYGFLKTSGYIENGVRVTMYQSSYIRSSDINPKPDLILQTISTNPGLCFSELKAMTGLQNGTLSHWLLNLEAKSKLFVKREKRRTWYFLSSINPDETETIIHLRKETSKGILTFLLENTEASFQQLQSSIQKAPSTISLTLTQLVELELVERIPGFTVKYKLSNKQITIDSLRKVDPNFLDSLKDRFSDTFSYL